MKVIDNFVWLVVTSKALEIFMYRLFDLYILHDDGSESLITAVHELNTAQKNGLDIAIEVGRLDECDKG